MTLVIRGGTVVTPGGGSAGDVIIDGERIAAVVGAGEAATVGARTLDADGLLVLPGMVDAHVHFQEPGREEWEGFDTGSAAAVAGGVTTVVDMPIDCDPPTVDAAAVRAKADAACRHSRVDVAMWGGLVPASLGDLAAMVEAGVVGFKAFACPSGWDAFPPADEPTLAAGMRTAAALGVPVAVHCELERLGHTIDSEVAAVRWAAGLAGTAGARLHVVHVSSAAAVDEARRWAGVTVETCPHYLLLDEPGPLGRCNPPVREGAVRDALWARVAGGGVDALASDHSPCPPARRRGPSPWAGVDGVGMTLPLMLTDGRLSLGTLVGLLTAAARILRLPGKGAIAPGRDADVVLVDPEATWEVDPSTMWSRHRASPFAGRRLRGRVEATLVRGRVVYTRASGPGEAGGGAVVRPTR